MFQIVSFSYSKFTPSLSTPPRLTFSNSSAIVMKESVGVAGFSVTFGSNAPGSFLFICRYVVCKQKEAIASLKGTRNLDTIAVYPREAQASYVVSIFESFRKINKKETSSAAAFPLL